MRPRSAPTSWRVFAIGPRRFPIVGDVRGLGLMIGFELVYDQQTKQRAPELRDRTCTDGVSTRTSDPRMRSELDPPLSPRL